MHTWSLAVEEQYYMLIPVFLVLLWRFGRNPVFYSIIAISIVSLLWSEWGWRNIPNANFYLAPTRAWELLAGSICAFLLHGKAQRSNNALSVLGLALIFFAIFYYDENTPFPSLYTLAPVVGTALVILYGAQGTWAARLLSTKLLVGVGLVSYSAYLWHYPLFAFARIHSIGVPDKWLMLLLAATSFVLAYFSWRFIEQPFRTKPAPLLRSQRAIFSVAGVMGAAFIAFGLYGYFEDGIEHRLTHSADSELVAFFNSADGHSLGSGCKQVPNMNEEVNPVCTVFSSEDNERSIAVYGDSHSWVILPAFQSAHDIENYKIVHGGLNGCPPLLEVYVFVGNFEIGVCKNFAQTQFNYAQFMDLLFLPLVAVV